MDSQKPIVGLGTRLARGIFVVGIRKDGVIVDVWEKGLQTFTFAQIEKMIRLTTP